MLARQHDPIIRRQININRLANDEFTRPVNGHKSAAIAEIARRRGQKPSRALVKEFERPAGEHARMLTLVFLCEVHVFSLCTHAMCVQPVSSIATRPFRAVYDAKSACEQERAIQPNRGTAYSVCADYAGSRTLLHLSLVSRRITTCR